MPVKINEEIYLTVNETRDRLGVSRQTVENLVIEGRLTKYRQGIRRTVYFKQTDVEKLLEIRPDEQ